MPQNRSSQSISTSKDTFPISFPPFTVTSKITDSPNTTLQAVIRVINALITNLLQIFTSLNTPQNSSIVLGPITLQTGSNQVVHTLGKNLTGWSVVGLRPTGSVPTPYVMALIYDNPVNPNPNQYLILINPNIPVTVTLEVF